MYVCLYVLYVFRRRSEDTGRKVTFDMKSNMSNVRNMKSNIREHVHSLMTIRRQRIL